MKKFRRLAVTISALSIAAGFALSCREADPPAPPAPSAPQKVAVAPPARGSVQPFVKLMESDAFFYLGLRDWKGLEVFDFIQTASRLRIVDRIKEIMEPGLSGFTRPEGVERRLEELAELRDKVSLRELLGGELALALFPGRPPARPVAALILRLPEGRAGVYEGYFRELISLSGFAGGEGEVEKSEFLGLPFYTFPLLGGGEAAWCRAGDILVAATARDRVERIVSRLLDREGGLSLAENRVFLESFDGLDASGRGIVYLQTRPLTAPLAENFSEFDHLNPAEGSFYLDGVLRAIETVERVAGSFDFDREAYREEVRLYLDEENGSQPLLDLVRVPPRSWPVLDYIPSGAADFSAGFIDPEKVYRPLMNFIGAGPKGGERILRAWKEKQAEVGVRLEEDILSWLGDELAFCTISLGRSVFDPGGWAFLSRFTSAGELDRFLSDLVQRARAEDLNLVAEEYGGCDFNILYLPIPLFPITPTAGRVGEFFVIASRRDIFTGIVDTYNRQNPSIRQDPDFQRLAAGLDGEGSTIYFSRLKDNIESQIALIRSSASMVEMFLPPPGARTEEGSPAELDSRQVIDLLNDITRVLEDFQVFRFRAGSSLYRDGYIQLKSVVEIGG